MSDKVCNSDYKACDGLSCSGKTFPCINEIRRRVTAEAIRSGAYVLSPPQASLVASARRKADSRVSARARKASGEVKTSPAPVLIHHLLVNRYSCYYCNRAKDDLPGRRLTKDHIIPTSRGGRGLHFNMVWACTICNGWKSNHQLHEWREIVKSCKEPKVDCRLVILRNIETLLKDEKVAKNYLELEVRYQVRRTTRGR